MGTDRHGPLYTLDASTETTAPDPRPSGSPRRTTSPPRDYVLDLIDISPLTDHQDNRTDATTFAPPQLCQSPQFCILLRSGTPMTNPWIPTIPHQGNCHSWKPVTATNGLTQLDLIQRYRPYQEKPTPTSAHKQICWHSACNTRYSGTKHFSGPFFYIM